MVKQVEVKNSPDNDKLREDQKAVGLEIGIDKDAVVSSIAQGAEDEILVINDSIDDIVNPERSCFDSILASVFEVVCSGPLQERVEEFMQHHCHEFKYEKTPVVDNDAPEYKHEHYVLFKRLGSEVDSPNAGGWIMQTEEVFDFLLSLVDFEAFRNDMISTAMHGQDLYLRGSPAAVVAED
ncbi:hypothetical protein Pmar_PMAR014717 [Perkinsus marinus ATCC 50983]|uniref:ADP-ribosylation factor-like protein 2-binding protein n=1 Tax=Perkinsus marinus (strain ATCC 50983 / TXsc) TaxID=423536 RepID=C5LIU5_PERM5|nr:hypothetical protein Pmar_PMAR014717 [Perkinsus marinus ATCC 50983]EER03498.1 hypothetical protein Pmar_PMAR014717 [Perkinsus marinus ATCC 50983]|eukprot:XP_002771682.1 hypothetical protein Pmar_PMAR014717 [Perkinsus marinus ATCC 50983]